MKSKTFSLPLVLSALVFACASHAAESSAPAKVTAGMLTGNNGMTLYTFDKDVSGAGKSACNGPCATNWPPLFVADGESAAGEYTVVNRDDGRKQWAFKGKPLYYWTKDQKPGDATGEGFNGVWRVARP